MMTGRFKTCMGVLLGSALALLYALPCSAESSSDLDQMQRELQALKAEMESLRADLGSGKEEIKVQNDELLASKKEYSQLSEQVRGLKQADPAEVSTLKDQLKKELGVVPNVYNDLSRKIRIGFESRTRAEYANNFSQITDATINMWGPRSLSNGIWFSDGIASNEQSVVLQRTRLNVDADVHEHLRAFFQLQDSRFWGIEDGTVRNQGALVFDGVDWGQNTLDLHQGYVDVRKLFNYPMTMRVGRQEIIWGDHRMMGNFDWHTTARSWDAIRGMYDTEDYAAEAFAAVQFHDPGLNAATGSQDLTNTTVNPTRTENGVRQKSNDHQNYGFMWTFKKLVPDSTLQIMFLHDNDQLETRTVEGGASQVPPGARGNKKIYDGGYRIAGKVGKNIDYASESHYQLGRWEGTNHRAWATSVEGGYTFNEVGWKPRLGAEFDWSPGSGHNGGVEDHQKHSTFFNFYPTNHMHYGYMDQMAWMNMKGVRGQVKIKPTKKLVAWADVWGFWLDNVRDYWYNAAGVALRGYSANTNNPRTPDSHLGTELDLTAKYELYDNVALQAGYSHFFNGDYLDDTALFGDDPATVGVRRGHGDADSSWGYLQLAVGF